MSDSIQGGPRRDKGKPSGANKEEGLGVTNTPPEKMKEYDELTDKYTDGEDKLGAGVPERHPNRNTSKGEDLNDKTGDSYA